MKKLEDIRLELGYYNQAEFAKKLGLSRSYSDFLSRLKSRGSTPTQPLPSLTSNGKALPVLYLKLH